MEIQIVASFAQPVKVKLGPCYNWHIANRSWLALFVVTHDFDHSRHLIRNKSISLTLQGLCFIVKSWIVHQFNCAQNSDFLFLKSSSSFILQFKFPLSITLPYYMYGCADVCTCMFACSYTSELLKARLVSTSVFSNELDLIPCSTIALF